jgi:hypothetical protein
MRHKLVMLAVMLGMGTAARGRRRRTQATCDGK